VTGSEVVTIPLSQLCEEVSMKKKVSVLLLVVLMLLLAFTAFIGPALGNEIAPQATVPFKAIFTTYPETVSFNPKTGILVLSIPADGNGTHLGKSEWYADSIAYLYSSTYPTQTGEMYFTAANGDQLFGYFEGTGVPNDIGGFDYWGDYWITEGSGRFSGATGSGIYFGGAGGGSGMLTFEGTLTNP
jgi:hypothetical protein